MKRVDYLIVGQGLAGSCLALELLRRKRTVQVIDRPDASSASRVAAGLFNPVTSKVRTSTWLGETIFPYLDRFYSGLSSELGSAFYFPMPMYRPFPSEADRNNWLGTENPFVVDLHQTSAFPSSVRDPFGGIELRNSGYCDTELFLIAVKEYLKRHNAWQEGEIDASIYTTDSVPEWKDIRADRVIWCEGTSVRRNPLFDWVPVKSLKGEVMLVESALRRDVLFNRGVYLVPDRRGAQLFRAGATYDHSLVPGNTPEGLSALKSKLDALLSVAYKETGASWGFRPTTPDRRPVAGPHPEKKHHWIFNGLGTKGVSLAPWFASQLAIALETGAPMMQDVQISRFYPLYFKSLRTS